MIFTIYTSYFMSSTIIFVNKDILFILGVLYVEIVDFIAIFKG